MINFTFCFYRTGVFATPRGFMAAIAGVAALYNTSKFYSAYSK